MIIYHSMIVWIAMMAVLCSLTKQAGIINLQDSENAKVPKIFAIFTFGYIIFWVGIRSGVVDTAAYIDMFVKYDAKLSAIPEYWLSGVKGPGFDTLGTLFKCLISDDYHMWFMFIAIITGGCIMIKMRKHSTNFFYSAFLFIVTLNFYWMLNGIRQFLVAAILFALSDWIIERKTMPFMVAVLLLSTIHYTAIIMIPLYFVATGKPFGGKMVFFALFLVGCVIFLEPFVSVLDAALAETSYSGAIEQFASDDGVHPLRVIVMAIPTILAFLGRKTIEKMDNPYINLSINMSFISAGLYLLGMFTSGILVGRLPIYFELYNLILLPYLLKNCFTKDSSRVMYILCCVGYLAFYYLQSGNMYYVSELTGVLN